MQPLSQEAQCQRIGERLKALRMASHQSQEAVAEAVHIGRASMARWESGKQAPQIWNLRELANFFGVEIGYFTDEHPKKPRPKERHHGD